MLLYLIRHAQSEANARVAGAPIDCELTDLGRLQVEAVAAHLATLGVDYILASPYVRVLETAEAIRRTTGAPAELFPLLHEHHDQPFPESWPLQTRLALSARFPHFAVPDAYTDTPWHQPPESHESVDERMVSALDHLRGRFASPDAAIESEAAHRPRVALVSHGSPVGKLVLAFTGTHSPGTMRVAI